MDTVVFISHRPFSQQAAQALQNLNWQNEITRIYQDRAGMQNSVGLVPLKGWHRICAARKPGLSPSGVVERGIKTHLMMNTGQNEKLWGGGQEGRGRGG